MSKSVKQGEIAVSQNDFGLLVHEFLANELSRGGGSIVPEWMDTHIRKWWPMIEEYYQRRIMTEIEVAILRSDSSRSSPTPLRNKEMWVKLVKDLRPPKAPYTVKYACGKCKTTEIKLWRGVHGCPDDNGNKLLCAICLAPGKTVDKDGKLQETGEFGMLTDQVKGWLPAIPVGDTYWGYSSVPSQDVEWWKALPTYRSK